LRSPTCTSGVGRGECACILSLATNAEATPESFKQPLRIHEELVHVTIEVNRA
jgi:hypothetical protein